MESSKDACFWHNKCNLPVFISFQVRKASFAIPHTALWMRILDDKQNIRNRSQKPPLKYGSREMDFAESFMDRKINNEI